MDLPAFGTVHGQWDLRGRFDEYIGGVNLRGKTVLDVGTASGFLTFEAEKRGASVISFDADCPERLQLVPPAKVDAAFFHGLRNSYRLAHHLFRSPAIPIYGDIYSMAARVPVCDVVVVGQILVHLRDPLAALEQAARSSKDYLIVAEGMFQAEGPHQDQPLALFLGAHLPYAWWHISPTIYRQWLSALGFEVVSARGAHYPCNISESANATIWTIVARRRSKPRSLVRQFSPIGYFGRRKPSKELMHATDKFKPKKKGDNGW